MELLFYLQNLSTKYQGLCRILLGVLLRIVQANHKVLAEKVSIVSQAYHLVGTIKATKKAL